MSRMRKQDEMENLRIENDRLKIDNTVLEDELQRLRDQLASRGIVPCTQSFNPAIKPDYERPLTPPESSKLDQSTTSPQSIPALTDSSSPSVPSEDWESKMDSSKPLFTESPAAFANLVDPADLKPSDDSRSAATCSLQWTSDTFQNSAASAPTPRRSKRSRTRQEQCV